jgi:nucleotide-binding universal stress UspA family protein
MNTIVVGIDQSEESRAALCWALAEARLRGAELRAITAWECPSPSALGWARAATSEAIEAQRRDARARLELALADTADPDAPAAVHPIVVAGRPAEVLIEASRDADLLVLGERRDHRLGRPHRHSITYHCLREAVCPVVVVPRGEQAVAKA